MRFSAIVQCRLFRNSSLVMLCLGMTLLSLNTGCFHGPRSWVRRTSDQAYSGWRNYVWAKRAYQMQYGNCEIPCASDFRDGFIAGYCNVCEGKDGYVPALPPEHYWESRFQNAEGQKRTKMWFTGFPAGAKAARETGAGAHSEIPISNMLEQAMQNDKQSAKQGISNQPVPSSSKKNATYSSQPIPVFELEWDESLER